MTAQLETPSRFGLESDAAAVDGADEIGGGPVAVGDGDAAGPESCACKICLQHPETSSGVLCESGKASESVWVCEECVDGETRNAEGWSAGSRGHLDCSERLTRWSHGDDEHGSDLCFLDLLRLQQFCCSSAADVCVVVVAADVAASLGTSLTDHPGLLHSLFQTPEH